MSDTACTMRTRVELCDELFCRAPRPPSLALDSPNVVRLIGFACRGRESTLGPRLSDDLSRSIITRATVPQKS